MKKGFWESYSLNAFSSLFISDFICRLVGFVLNLFLARTLSREGYGTVAFLHSIYVFLGLFADLGLGGYANREVSRRKGVSSCEELSRFVGDIVSLKTTIACFVFVMAVVSAWILGGTSTTWFLYTICFITVVPQGLNVEWLFLGREEFGIVGLQRVLKSVALMGLVLGLVSSSSPVEFYFLSIFIVEVMSGGGLLLFFWRRYGLTFVRPDFKQWHMLFKSALPIGVSLFLIQIYYSSDFILLGALVNMEQVGFYNAAYRIPLFLTVGVAGILISVFGPQLTKSYSSSNIRDFVAIHKKFKNILFVFALLTLVILPYTDLIITLLYGESFLPSVAPMNILLVNAALVFLSVAYGNTLLAIGRDRAYLGAVGAGAVINIFLNVLLIPSYGMMGAAVATLVAEIFVFALVYFYLNRVVIPSFL